MKNYSIQLAETLLWSLEKMDLCAVAFDEHEGKFEFVKQLTGPFGFLYYTIDVGQTDYTVLAFCPVRGNPHDDTAMYAMTRFVCCANHRSKRGGLTVAFDDGSLFYKHLVECGDSKPHHSTVSASISTPSIVLQAYATAIIDVLYRGKDPEAALEDCVCDLIRKCEEAKRVIAELQKKYGDDPCEEDPDDDED